jgi:hypothetical protein
MHIHPPLAVRTQCVVPPYGGHLAGTSVMLWQRWVQLVDTPFISNVRSTCVPATLCVVGAAITVAGSSLTIGSDSIVCLALHAHALALQSRCSHCAWPATAASFRRRGQRVGN